MIVFPNCKINLGLRILRKRKDGYHDLETIFYPLPIFDILELIAPASHQDHLFFSSSGTPIAGNDQDNLCIKAFELIREKHSLPPATMHLHKAIPSGAGLGGGSSDAAFTLRLINEKFGLGLKTDRLIDYASQLGSDCPFFIINKPAFGEGRGEILETVSLDLTPFKFIVVNPGIHINTGQAFSGIIPSLPEKSVEQIIQQPISTWPAELLNDFEVPVFRQYPEIAAIKNNMYEQGALYASMSGSGSTVYGIFAKNTATVPTFPGHYFVKELSN